MRDKPIRNKETVTFCFHIHVFSLLPIFSSIFLLLFCLDKLLLIDSCFSSFSPMVNLLVHIASSYCYRVFSLTWPAHMQIYWNKRKCLHKKRVQLPEDWFGTPTWPPFHCFGTPIWLPWRHMKTLYWGRIYHALDRFEVAFTHTWPCYFGMDDNLAIHCSYSNY